MIDKEIHIHLHIGSDNVVEAPAKDPPEPGSNIPGIRLMIPFADGSRTVGLASAEYPNLRLAQQMLYSLAALEDPRVNGVLRALGCHAIDVDGNDLLEPFNKATNLQ